MLKLILLSVIFLLPLLSYADKGHKHAENITKDSDKLSAGQIKTREHFKLKEQRALALPYKGVTTSKEKTPGLYPIQKTGIDNTNMVEAANVFLSSLTPLQRDAVNFEIDSEEWRKWSNVDNGIYARDGIPLKQMTPEQHKQLFRLFFESLSQDGMNNILAIMSSEHTLKELNGMPSHLDEKLYFISIMGTPSSTQPWGWQYEGHHLAINYFVLADQVVMSPVFMGAEPAVAESGKYKGNEVLQKEQNYALRFMQNLPPELQNEASTSKKSKVNMVAGANSDNLSLDYQGFSAKKLDVDRQEQLLKLINLFIGNLTDAHANIKMKEVKEHINETYFSWAGNTNNDSAFYYRIHSPVILIEFDHQAPIGLPNIENRDQAIKDHIHVMVRTPNGNDYGKDLLKQHLDKHHSMEEHH